MKASRACVALGFLALLTAAASAEPAKIEPLNYRIELQLERLRAEVHALSSLVSQVGGSDLLVEARTALAKAEIWHQTQQGGRAIRTEAQVHFFLYSIRIELAKAGAALGIRPTAQPDAPTAATIAGTVTGSDLPAPGGLEAVWVEFFDTNNAWVDAVQTDANGDYVSSSLSAGTYFAKTLNFLAYVDELYDDIPCHNICDMAAEGDAITVDGTPITGIDFDLDPGGTLSGTITDVDGGATLEGIIVDLFDTSGKWVSNTTTGADGVYISLGLPAGSYYAATYNELRYMNELYDNIACPFGCDPMTAGGTLIAVTVGTDNGGKDFDLAKGGWISGSVAETGASAIAGAIVEIFDSSGTGAGWGITDGSGNYSSNTGLPTGNYFAKTLAPYPYLDELYDGIACHSWCEVTGGTEIPVAEGFEKTGISFLLDRGGMISGTVTDSDTTNGIVGVWVEFFDGTGMHVGSALTGTGGVYTSFPLPAGINYYASTWNDLNYVNELYQEIACPFWRDRTLGTPILVLADATVVLIDFTLDYGATIGGTVTQNDGTTPIENIYLEFFDSNGDHLFTTLTDSSGEYTGSGLPPDSYYLKTHNDLGYLDEVYDNVPCPNWCDVTGGNAITVTSGDYSLGADFLLDQGGLVSGTVTEDPSGLPIVDLIVDIFDASGNHVSHGTTDSNGDFVAFYALVPGTHYAKTWNAQGYVDELYDDITCISCDVTQGTSFEVVAGSITPDIDFALKAGGWISGNVTDEATGSPIEGVHVDIFDSNGEFQTFGPSDSNGDYTVYNALPPGTYFATTSNDLGYANALYDDLECQGCSAVLGTPIAVVAETTTLGIDFDLDPGGLVAGTITDSISGLGIADVHLEVWSAAGHLVASVPTASDGSYLTTWALPRGSYFVKTWNDQGYINEIYPDSPCAVCDATVGVPIAIRSGATTTGVDFDLAPGGTISGTLTLTDPNDVTATNIQIFDANGDRVWSQRPLTTSGEYTTDVGLPTGTYYARTAGGRPHVNEAWNNHPCTYACDLINVGDPITVVAPNATTGVDFNLDPGVKLTGTVKDSGTQMAIDDSVVEVFDTSGNRVSGCRVGSAGSFTCWQAIPTGTYYAATVNYAGYIDELYGNPGIPCVGGSQFCDVTLGTPIAVDVAVTPDPLDFALGLGGWFEGSVFDAHWHRGLPGTNVLVYDSLGDLVAKVTWKQPLSQVPAGSYNTCGLPTGTYYAITDTSTIGGHHTDVLYDGLLCFQDCDVLDGTPISVISGSGTPDIDFALRVLLFADGFESGDTTAWSRHFP